MPTAVVAHPGAELYGSDRMVLETVTGLREAGWRVVVVLPETGPVVPLLQGTGAEVRIRPVPVLRRSLLRPAGLLRLAARSLRVAPGLWRLLREAEPDVVYVSTLTQPLWLVVARLARARVVCHVHEAEGSAPRLVRTGLAAPLLLASRVLVNSEFAREVLAGAVPSLRGRTVLVPNGVEGPPAPPAPVAGLRRTGGPLQILYVGRLSHRKGVDVLLEAVAELVRRGLDARLSLVGAVFPGYEGYEAELRNRAAEPPLAGRVSFRGFVHDVWAEAGTSHVWVVPSRVDEPFGNTAVEAVLAGRPLVATRAGGLSEAASGYPSATLVAPGDPVALAEAIHDFDRRWHEVAGHAEASMHLARRRHDPAAYRRAVVAELAP